MTEIELNNQFDTLFAKSIVQNVTNALLEKQGVLLSVLREDLIDKAISGNKLRKLKYNMLAAKAEGKNTLLSFGGAHSNHLAALAAAGKRFGFKTIGVIRGEELTSTSNSTLLCAQENGMDLQFIDRASYRLKNTLDFLVDLQNNNPDAFIIPEGGANRLGELGCAEILTNKTEAYKYICVSAGTGTSAVGIINKAIKQQVLVFSALKGDFLQAEIQDKLTDSERNWKLITDYHFGGFAKTNPDLMTFIQEFFVETNIPLDPIYTGKLFYGVFDLIQNGEFPRGSKILLIHTGGLQAWKGFSTSEGSMFAEYYV